jgi:NAD(P)-dependent dehydrogenase (short-subunit alcohol dehydrogenase family)
MMATQIDLADRVAIITGGSRGLGRAVALALADAGARVVVASRKQEGVDAVAKEIQEQGGRALAVAAHVGDESALAALVEQTMAEFGRVDVLVNNAGTNPHFGPLLTASVAQWDKIMEVNLRGAFLLCQKVVPVMREQGGGKIINMSSIAGVQPQSGMGVYSVSKAGLIMLTQALAQELGPFNIQVNALAPGVIKTRFSRVLWQTPAIAETLSKHVPSGHLGEVEDVVGAVLFLASPLADYVTGTVLLVDGGMHVAALVG